MVNGRSYQISPWTIRYSRSWNGFYGTSHGLLHGSNHSVGTGHGLLRGRSGRRSRAELEQAPEPELEQQRTAKGARGVSRTYLCLWVSETQTEYFLAF